MYGFWNPTAWAHVPVLSPANAVALGRLRNSAGPQFLNLPKGGAEGSLSQKANSELEMHTQGGIRVCSWGPNAPKGRGKGRAQGGPREKTGCDGISSEASADLTGSSGTGMVQIWGTGVWLLFF